MPRIFILNRIGGIIFDNFEHHSEGKNLSNDREFLVYLNAYIAMLKNSEKEKE